MDKMIDGVLAFVFIYENEFRDIDLLKLETGDPKLKANSRLRDFVKIKAKQILNENVIFVSKK